MPREPAAGAPSPFGRSGGRSLVGRGPARRGGRRRAGGRCRRSGDGPALRAAAGRGAEVVAAVRAVPFSKAPAAADEKGAACEGEGGEEGGGEPRGQQDRPP